jgi:hypothetical protein
MSTVADCDKYLGAFTWSADSEGRRIAIRQIAECLPIASSQFRNCAAEKIRNREGRIQDRKVRLEARQSDLRGSKPLKKWLLR